MKRYNTPHRSRVIKTRMTEEEYSDFMERLETYGISQAEFIPKEGDSNPAKIFG